MAMPVTSCWLAPSLFVQLPRNEDGSSAACAALASAQVTARAKLSVRMAGFLSNSMHDGVGEREHGEDQRRRREHRPERPHRRRRRKQIAQRFQYADDDVQ